MTYNLRAIANLINQALTDQDFNDLVFFDFPDVQGQLTAGMPKGQQVRILIEYVGKRQEIEKLIAAIESINPTVYQQFSGQISNSPPPKPTSENNNPITPPQTEIEKCDILILAANPNQTEPLQLEEEAKLIRQRLQEAEAGRNYIVHTESAATVEDLSRYLLQYEPLILHFSGHGNSDGKITFNNSQGESQVLPVERLAELIDLLRGRIECVVLNACFSLEKADVLADCVRCVIGMEQAITDESAIIFSGGFYRGLAFDRGYYFAFELGRQEIKNLNLSENKIPHFISRDLSILQLDVLKRKTTRGAETTKGVTRGSQDNLADVYPLWFGTDRQPVEPQNIAKGFSGKLDNQLHYGICKVAVPKSHKIGSIGSSWWQRLKKLQLASDRLKLQSESLQLLEEARFWANINQALQEREANERSALVFIHGFNVSFEAAALRAAQIGFDLQVPGIMAFYSWSSKGRLSAYIKDENTILSSETYIAEFLLNLARQTNVDNINIIAHSMGNRGLLRAMQRILHQVKDKSDTKFNQIFLAAPDVDSNLFRNLAVAYNQLAQKTTLYVSSKDKALASSGIIHDRSRAGYSPPITVIEGIDTVEVSDVDLTWLGHGYFADLRTFLEDMSELMKYNTPPGDRTNRLRLAPDGNYWLMRG